MGDVSYNSMEYRGWTRHGSDLVLTDPSKNVLNWTGRAGQQAVLTFRTFPEVQKISISWNGISQNVEIPAAADGRYEVAQAFSIPIYASHSLLLLFGALNFITLCFAANLAIWNHRTAILAGLERSASDLVHPTTGMHARLAGKEWWIVSGLVAARPFTSRIQSGKSLSLCRRIQPSSCCESTFRGRPLEFCL